MDRRKFPRIKIAKNKSGFSIKIVYKKFFFINREIECKLKDISDQGASLIIDDQYKRYISNKFKGKKVLLISESSELSFYLKKSVRVLRVTEEDNNISIAVMFTNSD